eukprot:TRINITY_DN78640_c0_g1_i1.p1 TRINITY_DN78640_c0_g1~~TRINITY_DN78640_c0_g1_i1.p1  ORF type:complete len:352 (-),score=38.59 TRINITY_DN78640_c0_g1_i1:30-1085(-)
MASACWHICFLLIHVYADPSRPAQPGRRVPQIIWAFWHDHADLPRAVQLARASWETFAPEYTVNFLDQHTWRDHVEPGTPSHCGTGRTFSEWLRLHLLLTHGGVWVDASIIFTAPLDLLVDVTANVSGVDIKNRMNFETSFIAAAPESEIMELWLKKYEHICDMSHDQYELWLVGLKADGVEALNGQYSDCDWASKSWGHAFMERLIHLGSSLANSAIAWTKKYIHPCGQAFWMHYLKINTSLNAALRTTGRNPKEIWQRYGIHTQPTEQTLMLVPHLRGYDDNEVAAFLRGHASRDIDLREMRGVKLSKGDRDALNSFETCEKESIICKVQALTQTQFFAEEQAPENQEL